MKQEEFENLKFGDRIYFKDTGLEAVLVRKPNYNTSYYHVIYQVEDGDYQDENYTTLDMLKFFVLEKPKKKVIQRFTRVLFVDPSNYRRLLDKEVHTNILLWTNPNEDGGDIKTRVVLDCSIETFEE